MEKIKCCEEVPVLHHSLLFVLHCNKKSGHLLRPDICSHLTIIIEKSEMKCGVKIAFNGDCSPLDVCDLFGAMTLAISSSFGENCDVFSGRILFLVASHTRK